MGLLRIDPDKLRRSKIFFATPMYGGVCTGIYKTSFAATVFHLQNLGIAFDGADRGNESDIARARSYMAGQFLRSDCTHLLWWDADIGAKPEAVVQLLALADPDSDKDIVGAPYCAKRINWRLLRRAIEAGVPDEELEKFTGHFVVNYLHGTKEIDLTAPNEVWTMGAGFMMIQRHVFKRMEHSVEFYTPDGFGDNREPTGAYFFRGIVDNRWFTEDYWFCHKAREVGMKLWVCPWIQLEHQGTYIYRGVYSAEAVLDAGATPWKNGKEEQISAGA